MSQKEKIQNESAVNRLDLHFLTGTPFLVRLMAGLRRPRHKVLGIDVAGQVASVGAKVTQFQPGDGVFGVTGIHIEPTPSSV